MQNLDVLNPAELVRWARELGKPKLRRAAGRIVRLRKTEIEEYEPL